METTIQKWGNSLGVRLPKSVTTSMSLTTGSRVQVSEEKGRVIIEVVPDTEMTLAEMVALIHAGNIHAETDWGDAQGNEVW